MLVKWSSARLKSKNLNISRLYLFPETSADSLERHQCGGSWIERLGKQQLHGQLSSKGTSKLLKLGVPQSELFPYSTVIPANTSVDLFSSHKFKNSNIKCTVLPLGITDHKWSELRPVFQASLSTIISICAHSHSHAPKVVSCHSSQSRAGSALNMRLLLLVPRICRDRFHLPISLLRSLFIQPRLKYSGSANLVYGAWWQWRYRASCPKS